MYSILKSSNPFGQRTHDTRFTSHRDATAGIWIMRSPKADSFPFPERRVRISLAANRNNLIVAQMEDNVDVTSKYDDKSMTEVYSFNELFSASLMRIISVVY